MSQIKASADQSESFVFDLASQWQVKISDFLSWKAESRNVLMRHLDTIGAFCHKFSLTEVLCESPGS
jgi:hypothetical protein